MLKIGHSMTSYGIFVLVSALKSIIQKVFTSGSVCTINAETSPNFNGQRAQLQRSKCIICPAVFTWRLFHLVTHHHFIMLFLMQGFKNQFENRLVQVDVCAVINIV